MMNLPNRITLSRIILLPVFLAVALINFPGNDFVAGGLFIILAVSDFIDGYIARKYNQVTDFGKFLDPIADKLLCTTGLLLLIVGSDPVIPQPYGIIVIFLILLRDYAINGLRQLAQLKGVVIPADMFGKVKSNFQYVMTVFGFLIAGLREYDKINETLAFEITTYIFYGVVAITTLLVLLSGISYLIKGRFVFAPESKNENTKIDTDNNTNETTESKPNKTTTTKKSNTKKATKKTSTK
ncbi:MAG: CDP-diacylglycerol--glycerol-3-phosphate 3-phosphatidyltransferase [Clostridiales bacterium]|nr:CDP-diacylglycerol--glycerol-3-phosphate 3-phosphatidyltransferase [Clostridiales bacterium]